MRRTKKIAILVILFFCELVLLSWVFAPNLPRRSADVDAFTRYRNAPTEENKAIWLKERQKTEREVSIGTSLGVCAAVGNLFLITWVARRPKISPT
jgi:hypothetical protein